MKILSRIIILLLSFQIFSFQGVALADSTLPSCGFNTECPKGLACRGSTGNKDNGICVLTGPSIALCNVTKLIKDFSRYFELFSIVAIGFAFFLGKISWGMIISVILGIAVIEGAVPVTKKLIGVDYVYCSDETIAYSNACASAQWKLDASKSKMASPVIYNMELKPPLCTTKMSCIQQTCTSSNGLAVLAITMTAINIELSKNGFATSNQLLQMDYYLKTDNNKIVSNNFYRQFLNVITMTDYIPVDTKLYFIPIELKNIPISSLSAALKIPATCVNVPSPTSTNYLVCTKACYDDSQIIKTAATTCAGLVL